MFSYLTPNLYSKTLMDIDLLDLKERKIEGLICDMDNTLISWERSDVDEPIKEWLLEAKMKGFKICLVSNGLVERVEIISKILDLPYVARAIKPRKKPFKRATQILHLSPSQIAVIGDQLFTDILGGNRMGMFTILVDPLSEKEFPGTKVTRLLERIVKKST